MPSFIIPASPSFKPLVPTITETSIKMRWKYEDNNVYAIKKDTTNDEDVTVVIKYKIKEDSDFIVFPEDGRIPAENRSAIIPGKFETSESYIFVYHVFEGDQQSIETELEESSPDDRHHKDDSGNINYNIKTLNFVTTLFSTVL